MMDPRCLTAALLDQEDAERADAAERAEADEPPSPLQPVPKQRRRAIPIRATAAASPPNGRDQQLLSRSQQHHRTGFFGGQTTTFGGHSMSYLVRPGDSFMPRIPDILAQRGSSAGAADGADASVASGEDVEEGKRMSEWERLRSKVHAQAQAAGPSSALGRSDSSGSTLPPFMAEQLYTINSFQPDAPLSPGDLQTGPSSGAARVTLPAEQHSGKVELMALESGEVSLAKTIVIGSINGLVALPMMVAFAAIVFQAPLYSPYFGALCKFFFFSSGVHQVVFLAMSTLPFAVGQVQDVGLIFLSSMASSVADICTAASLSAEVALGTTLLTFCVSTFIVGFLTMLVGKFRLAQLVQYVPLPVVGGYLGFVGYFIVAGGVGLATDVEINGVMKWIDVLSPEALTRMVPMVATTLTLSTVMERVRHPLVLPGMLIAIPLLFHIVRIAAGYTQQQAQDAGWVMQPMAGSSNFWDLWSFFNIQPDKGWPGLLDSFYWPALLSQMVKTSGLFMVVCFGSCMDVAAIQQDTPKPLDFNRELVTVGVSNMVTAGLGAGYTGSYIFSQTTFSMRAGITSRLSSAIVALMEFAVFALPFSVVQYVPKFFFGALLLWVGTSIVHDWLLLSYKKLSQAEYMLLWLTFVAIMWSGLELGIAAGIVMVTLFFAYEYAQNTVSTLSPVIASSGAKHDYVHQAVLDVLLPNRVAALALSGFVFFGNSTTISTKVEKIADELVSKSTAQALEEEGRDLASPERSALSIGILATPELIMRKGLRGHHGGRDLAKPTQLALSMMVDAPMYIIMDFRHVPRMDSTGARTFGTLINILAAKGVQVLFSGIQQQHAPAIKGLLEGHGVSLVLKRLQAHLEEQAAETADESSALRPGQVLEFSTLESAMRFCEGRFISLAVSRGVLSPASPTVTLEDVLAMHVDTDKKSRLMPIVGVLRKYAEAVELSCGQVLFSAGEHLNSLYIVESGTLRLVLPRMSNATAERRAMEYGPGCMVSPQDFSLSRPASATARCFSTSCRLVRFPRAVLARLFTEAPEALNLLQVAMTHSLSLDLVSSLERVDYIASASDDTAPVG